VPRIRAIAVIVAASVWIGGDGSQLHAGQAGPVAEMTFFVTSVGRGFGVWLEPTTIVRGSHRTLAVATTCGARI
jgi:hypothetical protein